MVLGTLAFLTVAEARDRARRYKAQASEGVDPVEEQREAKKAEEVQRLANALTFSKLVDRFEAEYLVRLKPAGITEKLRLYKRWMPVLGDKPVAEITEGDILAFINDLLKGRSNGRYEADRLVGVVRHLFKWAKKHHDPMLRSLMVSNPAADIADRSKPNARDRVLSHDEIKRFWSACETVGWPAGHILRLLLLTGQRENEVAKLRWSELDLANKVWNLPAERAKNSKAHIIHLSDFAMEILTGLPQINGSTFVFTLDGRGPYGGNFTAIRHRIHGLMGSDVPHWQIRDLRRTATTLMAELGVPHHVADKVLNHTSGQISGVAAVYNRFQYLEERKAALNALGRFIETLIGRDAGNVVHLRA